MTNHEKIVAKILFSYFALVLNLSFINYLNPSLIIVSLHNSVCRNPILGQSKNDQNSNLKSISGTQSHKSRHFIQK